ncbi:hypothetical protein M569_04660, partial [Genlisea aurea]
KQVGNQEKAAAAVDEEMRKMKLLPPNSSYASHRIRVLNKIRQLLIIQACDPPPKKLGTASQDEELEFLFSGLHL